MASYISADKIDHFIVFDHPCISIKNCPINPQVSKRINVSTVGTLNKQKGADGFLKFIKAIPFNYRSHLSVSLSGQVAGVNNKYLEALGVMTLPANYQMSRNQFIRRLAEADYLLFFHLSKAYTVTASGAILDAVILGKPIIALENDYFNYLFSKYGKFGTLESSPLTMARRLIEIVDGKFVLDVDFTYIRQQLSPESVARQLQEQLDRIGFNH